MRIAAISDSHGDKDALNRALKHMAGVDVIFHLGDYSKDIEHIKGFYSGQLYVVSGNCDCFINKGVPSELTAEIGGKRFFVTHGHKFRVKDGLNTLYYKGLELGADIVLFGHTHSSQVVMVGDMVILNPGSVSKPRNTQRPTYGIIEIHKGNIKPEIVEF
jgi:putative phosphoesterase